VRCLDGLILMRVLMGEVKRWSTIDEGVGHIIDHGGNGGHILYFDIFWDLLSSGIKNGI
jgi:hypothetical protein